MRHALNSFFSFSLDLILKTFFCENRLERRKEIYKKKFFQASSVIFNVTQKQSNLYLSFLLVFRVNGLVKMGESSNKTLNTYPSRRVIKCYKSIDKSLGKNSWKHSNLRLKRRKKRIEKPAKTKTKFFF